MDKKVIGILVAVIVVVAIIVLCVCLGNKGENTGSASGNPVVIVNESGEQEVKISRNVDTDPYTANIPNEILDFYLEKVDMIETKYKEEQMQRLEENPDLDLTSLSKLKYDLVFFDDNNVPEMVVTEEGHRTALYTYDAGKVIFAMRDEYTESGDEHGWPFGVGGNGGYDYVPRGNVIRNMGTEFAGQIRYYRFCKLDENEHNLVDCFDGVLSEYYFDDANDNGMPDEDESGDSEVVVSYHVGDKKVTAEEAKKYVVVSDDFEPLEGRKTVEEFKKILESLVNEK